MTMKVGNYTLWGEDNNLYPQEVFSVTSENKLLPEIIKKQVKFLFGKGCPDSVPSKSRRPL